MRCNWCRCTLSSLTHRGLFSPTILYFIVEISFLRKTWKSSSKKNLWVIAFASFMRKRNRRCAAWGSFLPPGIRHCAATSPDTLAKHGAGKAFSLQVHFLGMIPAPICQDEHWVQHFFVDPFAAEDVDSVFEENTAMVSSENSITYVIKNILDDLASGRVCVMTVELISGSIENTKSLRMKELFFRES